MKKVFFSFVIVAAGLLVASCGNKSAKDASGVDSTVTEQAAGSKELKEGDKGPGIVATEKFSFDVPEGWEIENYVESGYVKVALRQPSDQAIAVEIKDGKVEDDHKDWKQLDDKTIGDKTYVEKEDGSFRYMLSQLDDSHYLAIFAFHVASGDPILTKVIESINLK